MLSYSSHGTSFVSSLIDQDLTLNTHPLPYKGLICCYPFTFSMNPISIRLGASPTDHHCQPRIERGLPGSMVEENSELGNRLGYGLKGQDEPDRIWPCLKVTQVQGLSFFVLGWKPSVIEFLEKLCW